MKFSIIYHSLTGNTKLLADSIYKEVKDSCVYLGTPCTEALEADCLFVGSWTNKGSCSSEIAGFLKSLEGKKIFLFGTAGFGQDASYSRKILAGIKKNIGPSNEVIGEFLCQGKLPCSVLERYEKLPAIRREMMVKNFHDGQSHPDSRDIENLVKEVRNCLLLHQGSYHL